MPTPPALPPALLLTRPEPGARRIARALPHLRAVVSPVLRIVPVPHDGAALAAAPGLVFTSAHAVPAAGPGRGRPALCVGAATAEAARAAGFDVTLGAGTADSLLPLIRAASVPLLHPHGRHLAQQLPVPGIVVYDQESRPLTAPARALLAGTAPVILPVFSPRSAALLARQVQGARAPLWLVAISPAAETAFAAPAARRLVADAPSGAAMCAAIAQIAQAEQS